MRQAPAFHCECRSGRFWCVAWGALVCTALVSAGVWVFECLAGPLSGADLQGGLTGALGVGLITVFALCMGLWAGRHERRRAPVSLRWDGQFWWLDEASRRGNELQSGRLRAVMDLQAHLLLRFDAVTAGRGLASVLPQRRYLPLSRADLPLSWHALRCTLYSAVSPADSEAQVLGDRAPGAPN